MSTSALDLSNCALLEDEVLLEIGRVTEGGWPVGPSFMHSLSSLIEAVVIHDQVFYGVRSGGEDKTYSEITISSLLEQSSLVSSLKTENAVTDFPSRDDVDELLNAQGRDYSYLEFLTDVGGVSFSSNSPGGERATLDAFIELLERAPVALEAFGIYYDLDLWDEQPQDPKERELIRELSFSGSELEYQNLEEAAKRLIQLNYSESEIQYIDQFNGRAKAHVDLSKNLSIDLYPSFLGMPNHVGAIRASNTKARQLYEQVVEEALSVDAADSEIGKSNFHRVEIPPLTQIVLQRCRGDARALSDEMLALRDQHRDFRNYLTSFDRAWKGAATRSERRKLQNEFDAAWKKLIEKESDSTPRHTRIIHFLWELLKRPLNPLGALGEELVTRQGELSVIGQVHGLKDFWRTLADSPTAEQNRALVHGLFPDVAEEDMWQKSVRMAEVLNARIS